MKTTSHKNKYIFFAACIAMSAFVLSVGCTVYHNKFSALENQADISINGYTIPKVVIADACDLSGEKCLHGVVLIIGKINQGTLDAYTNFKVTNYKLQPTYVCFDSSGGDVEIAFELAKRFATENLGTCLAEKYRLKDRSGLVVSKPRCGSACNFMLLSSGRRVAVGQDLNFITHSVGFTISFCACTKTFDGSFFQHSLNDRFIRNSNNPDIDKHLAFISFGKNVANSSMHKLTKEELIKYAIFNKWI